MLQKCQEGFLRHFMPLVFFSSPWKHEKTCLSDVLREYRKRPVAWNGLRLPWPFKHQPQKMAKHTQTICRQKADELFECVWPFCGVGAWRVKVLNLRIFKKDNIWVDAIREWLKSICEKRFSKIISFTKYWEKRKTLSQEKLSPTSVFPLRHWNNQSWEILAWKNFFCGVTRRY